MAGFSLVVDLRKVPEVVPDGDAVRAVEAVGPVAVRVGLFLLGLGLRLRLFFFLESRFAFDPSQFDVVGSSRVFLEDAKPFPVLLVDVLADLA